MDWLDRAIREQQRAGRSLWEILRDLRRKLRTIDTRSRAAGAVRRNPNGRKPGQHVVVDRSQAYVEVRIGKALWRALSMPVRMDVQRAAGVLYLVALYEGDHGFLVSSGIKGSPRIRCTSADSLLPSDGVYQAEIIGSKIRITV